MLKSIFTSLNYKIFGVALLVLVAGYWCMGQGPISNPLSITVAPVLLVLAYCGLIPLAILAKGKPESDEKKKSGA